MVQPLPLGLNKEEDCLHGGSCVQEAPRFGVAHACPSAPDLLHAHGNPAGLPPRAQFQHDPDLPIDFNSTSTPDAGPPPSARLLSEGRCSPLEGDAASIQPSPTSPHVAEAVPAELPEPFVPPSEHTAA